MSRFPSPPNVAPPPPPPSPVPGPGSVDYNLNHSDGDLEVPTKSQVYVDASNPTRPTVVLLAEDEDLQLQGIKAALGDRIIPVRQERNRVVNVAGRRASANLLIFEKRSELKSLRKLDQNNSKQGEQVLNLGFDVSHYLASSAGKPEALDPWGFYFRGGSQVAYLGLRSGTDKIVR